MIYPSENSVYETFLKIGHPIHVRSLAETFLSRKDPFERNLIAIYGNDKDRNILLKDSNANVRLNVAKNGNDEHRDYLIDDDCFAVRSAIAEYGNNSHRQKLVNDPNAYVKIAIIKNGTPEQRGIFLNDTSIPVLECLAFYGNKEQKEILKTKMCLKQVFYFISKNHNKSYIDYSIFKIVKSSS